MLIVTPLLLSQRTLPPGILPAAEIWTATPTPPPTSTPIPTPTPIIPTPTPSADIAIGVRVHVSGTNNIGLNLRKEAGVNAERVDIAGEGESFLVVGGPTQADGLDWWLLRDETNPQREGWAAANYLVP